MAVIENEVSKDKSDGSRGVNVGAGERVVSAVAGSGLVAFGLAQRSMKGMAIALLGGSWLHRGVTGRSRLYGMLGIRTAGGPGVHLQQSIIVQRPRHEVFAFWRDLQNYPKFMHRVETIEPLPNGRALWRARGVLGRPVEWTSVLTQERENELLSWSTVEGSAFEHSGEVSFCELPEGRGTEVQVRLRYRAKGGRAAVALAKLLGDEPGSVLAEELRRMRQLLETGEIATVAGQSQGPRTLAGRALIRRLEEDAR